MIETSYSSELQQAREALQQMSLDMRLFAPKLAIMNDETLTRTPLDPSQSQILLFEVHDHIQYVLGQPVRIEALKSRQVYYSTASAALSTRALYFNDQPRRHTVISYDWASTKNIMEMMWQFFHHMPDGMRVPYLPNRSEPYKLTLPHTGAFVDSLSGEKADPGRGGNRYFLHVSEMAMFRAPKDLMNALLPSIPGIHGTTIIRETTARGFDPYFEPHWREATEMVQHFCKVFGAVDEMDLLFNRTGWGNKVSSYDGKKHPNGWWLSGAYFPLFAGWHLMRKYRKNPADEGLTLDKMTKGERLQMETYGLDLWQMAWRRQRIRELGGARVYHDDDESILDFDQEHPITPEVAFKASGKPYIKRAVTTYGLAYTRAKAAETYTLPDGRERKVLQPAKIGWHRDHRPKYNTFHECTNKDKIVPVVAPVESSDLTIWKTPFRDEKYYAVVGGKTVKSQTWSNRYVIGADIAEGLEQGDYSVAYVLDRVAWEYVAEYHGHPSPLEFAEILVMLALYYDRAWLMGEYNDQGPSVVPRIQSMYSHICPRPDVQSGDGDTMDGKLWFFTSERSKKFLADQLKESIESKPRMMPFPGFYGECEHFVQDRTGKLGADGKRADPGTRNFDDRMIAAGQAIVGHMYSPPPIENIVPRHAGKHLQKQFEAKLKGRGRSAVDAVPRGIKASRVL